jgi:hypothetical protein
VVSERSAWSGPPIGSPLTIRLTKAPESGQFLPDSFLGSHWRVVLSLTPPKGPSVIIWATLCPALGAL